MTAITKNSWQWGMVSLVLGIGLATSQARSQVGNVQPLEIGFRAAGAKETSDTVRLRPITSAQDFEVIVKNPNVDDLYADIQLLMNGKILAQTGLITLPSKETAVKLALTPEMKMANDLPLEGSQLEFHVDRGKKFGSATLNRGVTILSPKDYVVVKNASFSRQNNNANVWEAEMKALSDSSEKAPIICKLTLSPERIPGLNTQVKVRGVLLDRLTPDRPEAKLEAHNLRFTRVPESGVVVIGVDAIPRAFLFKTDFEESATNVTPTPLEGKTLRLVPTPSHCCRSGAGNRFAVTLELDNAAQSNNLSLDVELVGTGGDARVLDRKHFEGGRREKVTLNVRDKLMFNVAIEDHVWEPTRVADGYTGKCVLRGYVRDKQGTELDNTQTEVIFDNAKPSDAIEWKNQVRPVAGTTLEIEVANEKDRAPIKAVTFFAGKATEEELPGAKPGEAPTKRWKLPSVQGEGKQNGDTWTYSFPSSLKWDEQTIWGVEVVNEVGLPTVKHFELDKVAAANPAAGKGSITGIVTMDEIRQPEREVQLRDPKDKTKVIATTKTDADGKYTFEDVKDGDYEVHAERTVRQKLHEASKPVSLKAASNRKEVDLDLKEKTP